MAYGDDITEGIPYVLSNPVGATNPATGLSGAEANARAVSATTINQTFVSTAAPNPQTVAAATVSASKYGTVVTPIPVSAAKLKMLERLL